MVELYKFIFDSFWIWLGTWVFLVTLVSPLVRLAENLRK